MKLKSNYTTGLSIKLLKYEKRSAQSRKSENATSINPFFWMNYDLSLVSRTLIETFIQFVSISVKGMIIKRCIETIKLENQVKVENALIRVKCKNSLTKLILDASCASFQVFAKEAEPVLSVTSSLLLEYDLQLLLRKDYLTFVNILLCDTRVTSNTKRLNSLLNQSPLRSPTSPSLQFSLVGLSAVDSKAEGKSLGLILSVESVFFKFDTSTDSCLKDVFNSKLQSALCRFSVGALIGVLFCRQIVRILFLEWTC
ncbi:hypothetical protein Ciccas_004936 [Cichlidogyrus casuarinus]|uniref:Uncharacterized protein n=1 Tax=Cichlidogyrus casuarinus TaxID=1844966 RepID=A0ABD2QA36_9PLAT